jgi:integrase
LQYTMEYFNAKRKRIIKKLKRKGIKTPENEVWEKFIVIIPSRTIDWKGAIPKKKPIDSNADVYANKEEVEEILQYFKRNSFKLYLIFRTIADTGMRKGEIINAKISELNIEERHFYTKEGKTGEKIYPIQKDLAKKLEIYLNGRKKENVKTDILFLNKHLRQYNNKDFNTFLREARNALKINKRITTKTFRKTLNDYRKEMGCNLEDREMLIGHKNDSVNVQNYTRSDIKRHIKTYDNWYPYKDLNI